MGCRRGGDETNNCVYVEYPVDAERLLVMDELLGLDCD